MSEVRVYLILPVVSNIKTRNDKDKFLYGCVKLKISEQACLTGSSLLLSVSPPADLCGSGRCVVAAGRESGQTPLLLVLVDAIPLGLGELQETVHGPQVDQKGLGGMLWILLFS